MDLKTMSLVQLVAVDHGPSFGTLTDPMTRPELAEWVRLRAEPLYWVRNEERTAHLIEVILDPDHCGICPTGRFHIKVVSA